MLSEAVFLGKNNANIDFHTLERPVHVEMIEPLKALKQNAHKAGFTLSLASGYRSFERQLAIWNDKANGVRPVLDHNENPVDIHAFSNTELMFLILRWSALPGTSRHHWGSEVDVIDLSVLGENQSYDLTLAETQSGGVFSAMHSWLDGFLMEETCDFYRPYARDRGGVSPEPWHLSLSSVANGFDEFSSKEFILTCLRDSDLFLKEEVISHFDEIYERFIINIHISNNVT